MLIVFLLLLNVNRVQCQQHTPLIRCGANITGYIEPFETDYYDFVINNSYSVAIDTCFSVDDVTLDIIGPIGSLLTDSSCPTGDWCGNCANDDNYAENFTISMEEGIYIMQINPYSDYIGASYQLKISCKTLNITTPFTISSTSTIPNATLTYTTVEPSVSCDYYRTGIFATSRSNESLASIIITSFTINIQFNIKLNAYCNKSLCNILYIPTNNIVNTISLSINGIQNYFEISIITADNFNETHKIPNANLLLPVDGQYHHLQLVHTFVLYDDIQTHNIFKIDDVDHDYISVHSPSMLQNITYTIYISSPWVHAIDSSVSNICIKSSKESDAYIQCGDVLESTLVSTSDVQVFYLNILSDLEYLLLDSCGSLFDTYLYLWDINTQLINKGDDDGNCDFQEQLLSKSLTAGKYIFGVSGYGNLSHHDYGEWTVDVICKNSSTHTSDTTESCGSYDHIGCGYLVYGTLQHFRNSSHPYYYDKLCFTLTNPSMVYFDACGSLDFLDMHFYNVNPEAYIYPFEDGYCGWDGGAMKLDSLEPGEYILEISSPQQTDYEIHVMCTENIVDDGQYKFISGHFDQWFPAQLECEKQYGTSLATIITKEDIAKALEILERFWLLEGGGHRFWFGLYMDIFQGMAIEWQWVEGAYCNSTYPGDCTDIGVSIDDMLTPIPTGTYLFSYWFPGIPWNNTSGIYQETYGQSNHAMPLCNAPKAGYKPDICRKSLKCWRNLNISDDFLLYLDTTAGFEVDEFRPPIAYWNSKLFVVGMTMLHYANITLFKNNLKWNHKSYHNVTLFTTMISQRFTQYRSSLFLYVYKNLTNDVLLHVNLDTLEIQPHLVPTALQPEIYEKADGTTFLINSVRDSYCIVSGGNNVYIVRATSLLIYQIDSDRWYTTDFPDVIAGACVITNDHKYIYVFGNNADIAADNMYGYDHVFLIIKYDIESAYVTYVPTPNICRPFFNARAITGGNDKIYLHGCYPSPLKTLIFNINTEAFERETIDIDVPTTKYMAYYRTAQMTPVDDNVLFFTHTADSKYPRISADVLFDYRSFYYTITESISINFTETQLSLQHRIWPSDGFDIKYYLNDFENTTNNVYFVAFESNDVSNIIRASFRLNTSDDNCICMDYNCDGCSLYFNLSHYLSTLDNNYNKLEFVPVHNYNFTVLLRPKSIIVNLQRCNLTINAETRTTNDINPSITFNYFLSDNCYSRIGHNFSANIVAQSVNISKQLNIDIMSNQTISCKVCEIGNSDCIECNNNSFSVYHETNGVKEGDVPILIDSNMIDLRVISSLITIAFARSHNKEYFNDDLLYLLFLLVICIPLIVILAYYRREYKNVFEVNNALVLIIGCARFINDKEKKYFLEGVEQNVKDLMHLWKEQYKYDVFACNQDTLFNTRSDIRQFIDKHKVKLERNKYQCAIVHAISHGIGDGDAFLSSDRQEFNIDDIQRELTDAAKYDIEAPLIKITFNHGCRGVNIYNSSKTRGILDKKRPNDIDEDEKKEEITESKTSTDNTHEIQKWEDANWAIIYGTIKGNTISDCGDFTKYICNAFRDNLNKSMKENFRTLITEIRVALENETNGGEICNMNETLCEKKIRFVKSKGIETEYKNYTEIEINNMKCDSAEHKYTKLNQNDTNDTINVQENKGDEDETLILNEANDIEESGRNDITREITEDKAH